MDAVFSHHIRKNIKQYVNDMIVKMEDCHSHVDYLKDILKSARRYGMHLNPTKFSFEVHAGKFMGFMVTKSGIQANLDKCQMTIDMKSSINVKEVQYLTGHLVALSRTLSCACDKDLIFFFFLR